MSNLIFIEKILSDLDFSLKYVHCDASFSKVKIDSRECSDMDMFVALKGENSNGHNFLDEAIKNGAKICIIEKYFFDKNIDKIEDFYKSGISFVVSDDSLLALQKIAKNYLSGLKNIKKIAVVGSSGKTTVKKLIVSILETEYKVSYNRGNFNSDIGLPIVALNVDKNSDIAVFELGINKFNEMDILGNIVNPDIVVITNIANAHIGIFKTEEEIARQKSFIFKYVPPKSVCFIDKGNKFIKFIKKNYKIKIKKYDKNIFKKIEDLGINGYKVKYKDKFFNFNFPGVHNLNNCAAAVLVGKYFKVKNSNIVAALKNVTADFGRSKVITGKYTVIEECYNANPDSFIKSINMFSSFPKDGNRKILVMAGMRELGDRSEELHKSVAEHILNSDVDAVFIFGEEAKVVYRICYDKFYSKFFSEYDELEKFLSFYIKDRDLILLKGSRFFKLERLEKILVK